MNDTKRMHHHGKWKRRRPHTLPVIHRTLHRYSWERTLRHETAAQALVGAKHVGALTLVAFGMLLLLLFYGGILEIARNYLEQLNGK